ncbi:MAG: hypothetical protein JEZ04_06595 [Spirochaetales bacterium]|nr:hypothetical protein [Spirochaetales bacterium]
MVEKDIAFKEDWKKLMKAGREEVFKNKFIDLVPADVPGAELYDDAADVFSGEELAEVCAEIILTVFSDCSRDDFHSWDYEHLSFIIEASNKYDFKIAQNLANGLPQQLCLRVKMKNLDKTECD